jgi:hypothetical protein
MLNYYKSLLSAGVFLDLLLFPQMNLKADDPLRILIGYREEFEDSFKKSSGQVFRLEQHFGSRKEIWETHLLGDYSAARYWGRDVNDPFDDRIFVFGPEFAFGMQVVRREDGSEGYSLIDLASTATPISPKSERSIGYPNATIDAARYPWRFDSLDVEQIQASYNLFSAAQTQDDEITIRFSDPKDPEQMIEDRMYVDLEGKLVFRSGSGWHLSRAEWKRENYNSTGKKTESFRASRDYFSGEGEFGHGKFENGELIRSTDTISNTATPMHFGRRVTWRNETIDPAVFTPEYYGIESRMAIARGVSWRLWIGILVSVAVVAISAWMWRRTLRSC